MTMVKYNGVSFTESPAPRGERVIEAALHEIVFFVLKNKLLPIGKAILNTKEIDFENLELVGDGAEYALYADDGVCREYGVDRLRVMRR